MNYASIKKYDTANGIGIRTTLFVSGCSLNCKGCFNKDQQNFNYGEKWTKETEELFIKYAKDPMVVGVSILGGEPFQQSYFSINKLLFRLHSEVKKPIWLWTGYLFEDLVSDEISKSILKYIDVIIDGRFDINKKDLTLKYKGSSNQRVIDVKESLKQNKVIEIRG